MTLVWLILIPFIGGLLCWQAERFGDQAPRWIALGTMLLELAMVLGLWVGSDFSLPAEGAAISSPWIAQALSA